MTLTVTDSPLLDKETDDKEVVATEEDEAIKYEFDQSFQAKIASLFTRDNKFALKTRDIISPDYFENEAAAALVRMIQNHIRSYKSIPDFRLLPTILKAEIDAKRIRTDIIPEISKILKTCDLTDADYVADEVAKFARHQATERAILRSVDLLEKGQFDKINDIVSKALKVGLVEDGQDYDYFEEIDNRTQIRKDMVAGKIIRDGITTGYSVLDGHLYHYGWGRKELSCIMGAAKAGKSMALCDFTYNAALSGYNTLYVTLEVRAPIIADRMDAALSDFVIRELHKNSDKVRDAVKDAEHRSGKIKIREFGTGTLKPSQLNRMIENYRSDGLIFDLISVDYADIMAAEYRSDRLQDNLREIFIDLRAIAFEHNLAILTATQTNREGAKAATAKATDVGDDFNKVRTVDLLLGINASDEEIKNGKARLYFAASRNTRSGYTLEIEQDRERMKFIKKIIGEV